MTTMKKIFLTGNTAWSMYNFRAGLIRALRKDGFEVHVAAPPDPFAEALRQLGCTFHPLVIDNKGTSIRNDLGTIRQFRDLFEFVRPDVVLNYTIKPVIYGAIAARRAGIPFFSVITGLGSPFTARRLTTRVIEFLCRCTQPHAQAVFFLNRDDLDELVGRRVIPADKARLLPSEGVDLTQFEPTPHAESPALRFLFAGRLLWQKGVGVFVEAARIARRQRPELRCQLLGPTGALNASAITEEQVKAWETEGVIEYLGNTKDVRPYIADADCVLLPSYYREGVPRILLEAAAMSRPIITTDMPGCRDVVAHGVNGLLCRAESAEDLAEKMLTLAAMSHSERQRMGIQGRLRAEQEFDERVVLEIYRQAIQSSLETSTGQ